MRSFFKREGVPLACLIVCLYCLVTKHHALLPPCPHSSSEVFIYTANFSSCFSINHHPMPFAYNPPNLGQFKFLIYQQASMVCGNTWKYLICWFLIIWDIYHMDQLSHLFTKYCACPATKCASLVSQVFWIPIINHFKSIDSLFCPETQWWTKLTLIAFKRAPGCILA